MKWYTKEEEYLQNLHELCLQLSKEYMTVYLNTHKVQTRLRLPAIILSSCSGVASFGSSSFSAPTMRNISIGVGVINVFIAIIQTYESYLKIGDIVSKSLSGSQALKKLADDIQVEVFIPVEDRNSNGITFLRDCFARYQTILDQAPPLRNPEQSSLFSDVYKRAKDLSNKISNEIHKHDRHSRTSDVFPPRSPYASRSGGSVLAPIPESQYAEIQPTMQSRKNREIPHNSEEVKRIETPSQNTTEY